jgi:hypothetical protein
MSEIVTRVGLSLLWSPFLAVGSGCWQAVRYIAAYAMGSAVALGVAPTSEVRTITYPPKAQEGKRQPAFIQYLFGPVWSDLRHLVRIALGHQWKWTTTFFERNRKRYFATEDDHPPNRVFGSAFVVGMVLGFLAAEALIALTVVVEVTILAALWGVSMVAIHVLRAVDSTLLQIRGIRVTCPDPDCYNRVPYPAYECPGEGCVIRHQDVRPGRYGVLRRRCRCGAKMPTLLLLGSHRMKAYCPGCQHELEPEALRFAEIVLPVVGATVAGKTQLLTAFTMATKRLVENDNGGMELADTYTQEWFRQAEDRLASGKRPDKTPPVAQRPYVLKLVPAKGDPHMLKLFDAAGEAFTTPNRVRDLQYLRAGTTFLFVLDPLSIPQLWDGLPAHRRSDLEGVRATVAPIRVLSETVRNMHEMNVNTDRSCLAVVISKADLIEDEIRDAGLGDEATIREWLDGRMSQSRLLRVMDTNFGEVRFWLVSALAKGSRPDPSVESFARTVLTREGVRI